jgi:hypothetical protein
MVDVKKIHCKCRFGTMKMFARSFGDLDMYLALDMYPTTDIR